MEMGILVDGKERGVRKFEFIISMSKILQNWTPWSNLMEIKQRNDFTAYPETQVHKFVSI